MTGKGLNTAHLWVHAMFNLVIFGVERFAAEMGRVMAGRDYQNRLQGRWKAFSET